MRHGLKLAKLSRPTAHRVLMLRNLVSSLLQHEQVTTTLPKAKAAQKLADQLISWGKQGGKENWERANGFLLNGSETLKPLFDTLAKRYATRPGGYTRVQRAGFRVGDRAPLAVLELVDNANDLRFENAARTVGREMALRARADNGNGAAGPQGWKDFRARVESQGPERIGHLVGEAPESGKVTRQNVVKALRYRQAPVPVTTDSVTSTSESSSSSSSPSLEADADSASSSSSSSSLPTTHPSLLFLDRAYHHYLATLASSTLSTPSIPDPLRPIRQLSARLRETEAVMERKGAPRPVVTVPRSGRVPKAGQNTAGWAATEAEEAARARGGPISRAKGAFGREARKERQQRNGRGEAQDAGTVDADAAAATSA